MYWERWRPEMPWSDQWALDGDYVMNLFYSSCWWEVTRGLKVDDKVLHLVPTVITFIFHLLVKLPSPFNYKSLLQ